MADVEIAGLSTFFGQVDRPLYHNIGAIDLCDRSFVSAKSVMVTLARSWKYEDLID